MSDKQAVKIFRKINREISAESARLGRCLDRWEKALKGVRARN
jgi:hypothetical protein